MLARWEHADIKLHGGHRSKVATVDSDLRRTALFLCGVPRCRASRRSVSGRFREADLWASTLPSACSLMGGAALVGGVVGLLFGIPKSVSDPAVAPIPPKLDTVAGDSDAPDTRARSSYAVNTNLEQISDWLTKIMVGVGLTQVGAHSDSIYRAIVRFRERIRGARRLRRMPVRRPPQH